MLNTGRRVQEILDLRPCDLQLFRPFHDACLARDGKSDCVRSDRRQLGCSAISSRPAASTYGARNRCLSTVAASTSRVAAPATSSSSIAAGRNSLHRRSGRSAFTRTACDTAPLSTCSRPASTSSPSATGLATPLFRPPTDTLRSILTPSARLSARSSQRTENPTGKLGGGLSPHSLSGLKLSWDRVMWSAHHRTPLFQNELRDRLHSTAVSPRIEDQQLGLGVDAEPLLEVAFGMRLVQGGAALAPRLPCVVMAPQRSMAWKGILDPRR